MTPQINIREATVEDRMAIWSWYQEPLRRIVFPGPRQESRDAHKAWWQRMEADADASFWIGLVDIIRIGCVRFQRQTDGAVEVFAFLKPAYHRQHLLAPFVAAAMEAYGKANAVTEFRLRVSTANRRVADVLPAGARIETAADGETRTFHWAVGG